MKIINNSEDQSDDDSLTILRKNAVEDGKSKQIYCFI